MSASRKKKFSMGTLLARLVLVGAGLSALVPVLWTFLNSFKNRVDIVSAVPRFFFTPTLENYVYVLSREAVAQGLLNSVLVVGAAVIVGAVLGLRPRMRSRATRCAGPTTSSSSCCRCASCRRWPWPFR